MSPSSTAIPSDGGGGGGASSPTWCIAIKTVGSISTSLRNKVGSTSTSDNTSSSTTLPPVSDGWGNIFANQKTQWKCSVCTSQNPKSENVCLSCEAPAPSAGHNSSNNNSRSSHSNNSNEGSSSTFTIQINPNEPLSTLSNQIEDMTGLRPHEQRLIYRGRIINVPFAAGAATTGSGSNTGSNTGSNSGSTAATCIRDIHGLSDGETIHLVPRHHHHGMPSRSSSSSSNSAVSNNGTSTAIRAGGGSITNNNNNNNNEEENLLANALLGGLLAGLTDTTTANGSASNSSNVNSNNTIGNNTTTTTSAATGNIASLSGTDGMNLLAALLGLSGNGSGGLGSGGVGNNNNGGMNNVNGNNVATTSSDSAPSPVSNTQGLGGIVSRAAMMGVLDTGGVATGGSAVPTTSTPGLLNRSIDEIRSSRNAAAASTTTAAPSAAGAIRAARDRRRATAARLTASDIRVANPGSMEPVRQGLLTLHTLLGNVAAGTATATTNCGVDNGAVGNNALGEEKGEDDDEKNDLERQQQQEQQQHYHDPYQYHPLDAHRQWFRGQWIDALDTVNQWLEATIVDIVLPSDLLGSYAVRRCVRGVDGRRRRRRDSRYYDNNGNSQQRPPVEAVVSANDLEGRRRLLLEPSPPDDTDEDDDNISSMGVYDLLNEGYRPRDDNDGVQLLLIHYNGWPHRWDEWIRSDSPRLRPFRTRTRHRIMSSHASPTPQAAFQAAPSTFIRCDEDEGGDDHDTSEENNNNINEVAERTALLPELQRVISGVNDLLLNALSPPEGERGGQTTPPSSLAVGSSHLPWQVPIATRVPNNSTSGYHLLSSDDMNDDGITSPSSSLQQRMTSVEAAETTGSRLNAAQLRHLAPLIDRLGRSLTDAAPHIAALADALPSRHSQQSQAGASSDDNVDEIENLAAQASHLYFGLNTEENNGTQSHSATASATAEQVVIDETTNIDPDVTDFVNGMVNTTRGGSPRDTNREPLSPSLLASYLSSIGADGGLTGGSGNNNDNTRVIRVGGGGENGFGGTNGGSGGGGPGIDIHIHAIVTGPGMNIGGLGGLGGVGSGTTLLNRTNNRGNAAGRTPVTATTSEHQSSGDGGIDGDEIDLFSDLYSESPPPLNLHQERASAGNSLNQVFEECCSIEEDSDSAYSAATQPFDSDGKVRANGDEDNEHVAEEEDKEHVAEEEDKAEEDKEEETTFDDSELVDESNDTSDYNSPIELTTPSDADNATPAASRRASSSFGSRMYRRTIGRLSSRRVSGA